MLLKELNPHIRFASRMTFKREKTTFNVFDCRIFYIHKGTLEMEIDGHNYILSEGNVFYCAGASVYTTRSSGCELFSLNFDLTQKRSDINQSRRIVEIEKGNPLIYTEKDMVEDCDFLNNHLYVPSGYRHHEAISEIINEFAHKMIFYREKTSGLLKNLLIEMHRLSQKTEGGMSDSVENVIAYLSENFNKKISNEKLASIAGYHEYHLNRLFVRDTGKTLHQYILSMRISESKRLLANTDMSFSDIADAAGFSSNTHFAGCFKKMVGQSPSEYKASMKSKI